MSEESKLDRRSFLGRVMGGVAIAGAATVLGGTAARAQVSDSDPTDAAGRGRTGRTDSDPTDGAGRGRGTHNGRSDSDPTDSAGQGRTGRTDSDPTDGVGRGRPG